MCQTFRAFLELVIMNDDNVTLADACEVMLYAKDGVYMMQIPRLVPAMYLPTAGRAEVFVRCTAPVGSAFYMAAGTPANYNGALLTAGCAEVSVRSTRHCQLFEHGRRHAGHLQRCG
jgi:hypothetical protein